MMKWGMQIPAGLVSTTAASCRIMFMTTLFKDCHFEIFVLILTVANCNLAFESHLQSTKFNRQLRFKKHNFEVL